MMDMLPPELLRYVTERLTFGEKLRLRLSNKRLSSIIPVMMSKPEQGRMVWTFCYNLGKSSHCALPADLASVFGYFATDEYVRLMAMVFRSKHWAAPSVISILMDKCSPPPANLWSLLVETLRLAFPHCEVQDGVFKVFVQLHLGNLHGDEDDANDLNDMLAFAVEGGCVETIRLLLLDGRANPATLTPPREWHWTWIWSTDVTTLLLEDPRVTHAYFMDVLYAAIDRTWVMHETREAVAHVLVRHSRLTADDAKRVLVERGGWSHARRYKWELENLPLTPAQLSAVLGETSDETLMELIRDDPRMSQYHLSDAVDHAISRSNETQRELLLATMRKISVRGELETKLLELESTLRPLEKMGFEKPGQTGAVGAEPPDRQRKP